MFWNTLRAKLSGRLRPWSGRSARAATARADRARDAGQFADALALYEEALRLSPRRSALHVQAGHMAKEARCFEAAERHYRLAEAAREGDADLQLQLGHFCKTIDRLDDAERHYRLAMALAPGWGEAAREVARLERRRGLGAPIEIERTDGLVPELLPRPPEPPTIGKLDEIIFRRLGQGRIGSSAGNLPVLAGVEALHGLCYVDRTIVEARVIVDGAIVHRGPIDAVATSVAGITKAVFNLWVDCSGLAPGPHRLELVLVDEAGGTRSRFELVHVALPLPERCHPLSDNILTLDGGNGSDPEAEIRARPSMVRPAGQPALAQPRAILVLRTDQLGDMAVSVPALQRLRALYPDARIVGLVTRANAELAQTLDLFDEIIVADFPDDPVQRQRVMTADAQRVLGARLVPYAFDVAIDLATSSMSRPLLKLAGARFTFGFDPAAFPWLDGGISGHVHGPHDGSEASAHAGRVLALIERLATLTSVAAPVLRRLELGRDRLAPIGIDPDRPFIVLHTGARIRFSRWPHYLELAAALAESTGNSVVVLGDAGAFAGQASPDPRVLLIGRQLPFDSLDALLSHCALFVGNDSGPKHLAALRGVPVLSLHSARIHWLEWGQQQTGLVISRRVPCANCAIYHDEDECGKGHACITDIRPAEVLAAAMSLLGKT